MPTFSIPSGQFNSKDAEVLRKIVKSGDICEIGCWTGASTSILAEYGEVTVIDWFKGSPTTHLIEEAEQNNVRSIFERNMTELGLISKIRIFEVKSDEIVDDFEDESFDFIFIDGDHRYEQVKKDIQSWLPKVKKGGRIAGHDFDKRMSELDFDIREGLEQDTFNNVHCGVILAVTEEFKNFNNEGRIWWSDK